MPFMLVFLGLSAAWAGATFVLGLALGLAMSLLDSLSPDRRFGWIGAWTFSICVPPAVLICWRDFGPDAIPFGGMFWSIADMVIKPSVLNLSAAGMGLCLLGATIILKVRDRVRTMRGRKQRGFPVVTTAGPGYRR